MKKEWEKVKVVYRADCAVLLEAKEDVIVIQYTRILRSTLSALGKISFHLPCLAGLVRKSSAGKTHRHLSVVVPLLHNVSLTQPPPKHSNYSYNQSPMRLPASQPCMARRQSKRIACAFLNSLRTPCRRVHSRSMGSHPRAILTFIPENTRSRRQRRSYNWRRHPARHAKRWRTNHVVSSQGQEGPPRAQLVMALKTVAVRSRRRGARCGRRSHGSDDDRDDVMHDVTPSGQQDENSDVDDDSGHY